MIALSLLLAGFENIYVTMNSAVYLNMLNEADADMEQNMVEEALSIVERLDYRFDKQSKVFESLMYHSEIGAVSSDLAMLRRYAQTGDTGEFLATSAKAKREIVTISNDRLPRIENLL